MTASVRNYIKLVCTVLIYCHVSYTIVLTGTDSILDTGSAHMSIATKQYLQRHHLLNSDGNRAPSNTVDEGGTPTGDCEGSTQTAVGSDNILNIRRLKMLPKLI